MEKICTSLVQSYKLLKLKFDAGTADMCWATELFGESLPDRRILCMSSEEYTDSEGGRTAVPAWSLPALTKLVTDSLKSPTDIRLCFCKAKQANGNKYNYHVRCTFDKVVNGITCTYTYRDGLYTGMHEELLDAVFELVCTMKQNQIL